MFLRLFAALSDLNNFYCYFQVVYSSFCFCCCDNYIVIGIVIVILFLFIMFLLSLLSLYSSFFLC